MSVEEYLKTADKRTRKYRLVKKYIDELGTDMKQDIDILWEHIQDILEKSN